MENLTLHELPIDLEYEQEWTPILHKLIHIVLNLLKWSKIGKGTMAVFIESKDVNPKCGSWTNYPDILEGQVLERCNSEQIKSNGWLKCLTQ